MSDRRRREVENDTLDLTPDAIVDTKPVRILCIGGSDSSAGAGIQADLKTASALGGYCMTAVTAVTAQDSEGVHAVHAIPAAIVREQIRRALGDFGADSVKTGMLATPLTVVAVADALKEFAAGTPLVVDPVMIAKGGRALLDDEAVAMLTTRLLPLTALVTPNAPEAARLAGIDVASEADQVAAGEKLIALGARAALIKGGHVAGATVSDALVTHEGAWFFRAERIDTRHTHGTGCTLATAIATGLAQGDALIDAVAQAHAFVQEAIRTAPGLGRGHGPLNHFHAYQP